MANPSPYTTLQAQIGKVEDNAERHATDAETHTARHEQERDAERNAKAAAKHPGANTN